MLQNCSDKIIAHVLMTFVLAVLGTIGEEKIHLKIHVPEIINHHIHTKLLVVHEDDPFDDHVPQINNRPYDEESYAEQWSSWNNNGHIGGQHRSKLHKYNGQNPPNMHLENGVYMTDGDGEEIVGFTYPPQYADDVPHNNIESYMEDTYRRGLHSESGHLITNDQDNYYDVNKEEADLTDHDYYHEEHENRDLHSHHHYDKEIGHEDRVGRHPNRRKYFIVRMVPRRKCLLC